MQSAHRAPTPAPSPMYKCMFCSISLSSRDPRNLSFHRSSTTWIWRTMSSMQPKLHALTWSYVHAVSSMRQQASWIGTPTSCG